MQKLSVTDVTMFFHVAASRFIPEKAKGVDVTAYLEFEGQNGGNYTATIKNQRFVVTKGAATASPTFRFKMKETDFLDLVNGKLGLQKALLTRKIKYKGDVRLAKKLYDRSSLTFNATLTSHFFV
jgi:putative sterol carrier protein